MAHPWLLLGFLPLGFLMWWGLMEIRDLNRQSAQRARNAVAMDAWLRELQETHPWLQENETLPPHS